MALHKYSLIVGAAMDDRVTHPFDFCRFDSAIAFSADYACNATHVLCSWEARSMLAYSATDWP